jgi:hypothetical protein
VVMVETDALLRDPVAASPCTHAAAARWGRSPRRSQLADQSWDAPFVLLRKGWLSHFEDDMDSGSGGAGDHVPR